MLVGPVKLPKSKCVGQCNLGQDDICTGCNRSIEEIYELGKVSNVGSLQVSPDKSVERVANSGHA